MGRRSKETIMMDLADPDDAKDFEDSCKLSSIEIQIDIRDQLVMLTNMLKLKLK